MISSALYQHGVLLLCVATFSTVSLAQQSTFTITFEVTALASQEADQELHRQAIDALRSALTARGALSSEKPEWVFLVGAIEVNQGDQVVLSVATLHSLPEQAIQWGRKAEIFYATEQEVALPAEGKGVREEVSEEFIRQFAMVQDHDTVVVDRSDLTGGMSELASRFYRRHTRP